MSKWILRGVLAVGVLAFFVPAAQAQDLGFFGVGVRAGLNTYPNQFLIGGQINAGEFIKDVRFQPSATVGVGDDRLIFLINVDAAYHLPIEGATWNPYLGGGLGVGIENKEDTDTTQVEAGLNIFGGIEWGASQYRYFVEARTQIGTSLGDFAVLGGINF